MKLKIPSGKEHLNKKVNFGIMGKGISSLMKGKGSNDNMTKIELN